MVLGLIALVGSVPMTVTSVLSMQSQAENAKEKHDDTSWKTIKCHMKCRTTARTQEDRKTLFENSYVVLRSGKLYVQLPTYDGEPNHPFTGYYLPYPDSEFDGLVSTISDNPPQLNWIYLDTNSSTFQICHGLRAEAQQGVTGPWGARICPNNEKRFLFAGWEGFIAIETNELGLWSLNFDKYDNGLQGRIKEGQRAVEVELIREEMEN